MADSKLDDVLKNIDRMDRTVKLAVSWGATPELAELFAAKYAAQFTWDGIQLTFSGKNAVDDPDTRKHFTEGALAPLFPATVTNNTAPKIDPALLASARSGNWTSIGALARRLGSREAAEAMIADTTAAIAVVDDTTKAPVKVPALKGGTNPWTPDTVDAQGQPAWSLAARRRQTDLVKTLGPTKAAEIAKAAGSFLGATSPRSVNMTSNRRSA
jgi:hypothetical protein